MMKIRQRHYLISFFLLMGIAISGASAQTTGNTGWKDIYNEAVKLYKQRDNSSLKKALVQLEELNQKNANNQRVMALMSHIYAHLDYQDRVFGAENNEYNKKALEYAQKALAVDSRDFLSHRALGNIQLRNKNYDEAASNLKKGINLYPKDSEGWYLLSAASPGNITVEDSSAGRYIRKALSYDPDFLWAHEDLVSAYLKAGDVTNAKKHLNTIETKHSGHPDLPYYRAMVLLHEGRVDEARQQFKLFVQQNPDRPLSGYIQTRLKPGEAGGK